MKEKVKCICGCGNLIDKYDSRNRRRYWSKGHFLKGKKPDEKTLIRLRTQNIGRKHSEKTKKKMSESRKGAKHWKWKGGRTKIKEGYIMLRIDKDCPYKFKNGSILEHRYVWWKNNPEDIILEDEVIHHINGIKDDNRIENLRKMKWKEHDKLHKGIEDL